MTDAIKVRGPKIDVAGKRFGRLTGVRYVGSFEKRSAWEFLCDCGSLVTLRNKDVLNGKKASCGCLRRESVAKIRFKHGLSSSPEHRVWAGMLDRCGNENNKFYYRYGGRGIRVCERWHGVDGFVNFLADMGEKPGPEFSIERKNNDGDYEPGNCCWATRLEQNNNTSRNRVVEYRGKTQTVSQWARECGISESCLRNRLKAGWPLSRAISGPERKHS